MGGKQFNADAELRWVLRQYALPVASFTPISTGLVHRSYFLRDALNQPLAVAQRLHPIFTDAVNIDVDAVSSYLTRQGVAAPTLIRSRSGSRSVAVNGHRWRILRYLSGVALEQFNTAQARSAGATLGHLHRVLSGLRHEFVFYREVHNTAAHLQSLKNHVIGGGQHTATALGRDILAGAAKLPPLPMMPRRILHGDPKRSNLLFHTAQPNRAYCFIDLDGVGHHKIAYELGDALRSWCDNGTDADPEFSPELFRAALTGYRSENDIAQNEAQSVVISLRTVCIELAARFCTDAFEDQYFGWDPTRYKSRVAHNLARAHGQLALATKVANLAADGQLSIA